MADFVSSWLRRQPQANTPLAAEWAPFCKCAIIGGNRWDFARDLTIPSGLSNESGPDGRGFRITNANFTLSTDTEQILPTGSECTILIQVATLVSHGGAATFGVGGQYDASYACTGYLPYATDGKLYFRWAGATDGTTAVVVPSLTYSERDWFALTVGKRGMEVWQNGKKVGSNAATPSRTIGAGSGFTLSDPFSATPQETRISMFATLGVQMPVSFLAQRNYWGLWRNDSKNYFLSTSTGTANNINVPTASITINGFTPVVNQSQGMAIPVANISLAANIPIINQSQGMAIPLATIVLNGIAPDISQTLANNVNVPAAPIVLAANAPTVDRTGGLSLDIPLSTIVLNGIAPVVDQTQSILIPAANITINASAPTISQAAPPSGGERTFIWA